MVTVYQFKAWDHAAGEMKTQPLKSPKERIERVGGEIIEGTAEDVSDDALDAQGRFDPLNYGLKRQGSYSGGGYGVAGAYGAGPFAQATDPKAVTDPKLSPGARIGSFALNSAMFNEASNARICKR